MRTLELLRTSHLDKRRGSCALLRRKGRDQIRAAGVQQLASAGAGVRPKIGPWQLTWLERRLVGG
jgi:hypothetical protein